MSQNFPPSSLDSVADGTAAGFTPVKSAEIREACNRFLRSRGIDPDWREHGRKLAHEANRKKATQAEEN